MEKSRNKRKMSTYIVDDKTLQVSFNDLILRIQKSNKLLREEAIRRLSH
jgi:hypothetical protein